MRFSTRTWALLSVMLFIGAIFFWLKGNEVSSQRQLTRPEGSNAVEALVPARSNATSVAPASAALAQVTPDPKFPHRLRNTAEPVSELAQRDSALLLANALIDTDLPGFQIPSDLKAAGPTRNFIVQANSAVTPEFRERLTAAGATVVSYVPNNAYLVRAKESSQEALAQLEGVKAALPYEPYYKLHASLLKGWMESGPQGVDLVLRVTTFPGAENTLREKVRTLGSEIIAEEQSPFGQQYIFEAPDRTLAALAQMDEVQLIEWHSPRAPANDLTRVQVGITTNSEASSSTHLDLTGENVWININDTGIDRDHPALAGRVFSIPGATNFIKDPNGHGTFVAGTLAGNGGGSTPSATEYGSGTNANFKGMAPEAKLFGLSLEFQPDVHAHVLDNYLIDIAARTNFITLARTNALISNNSWNYPSSTDYDSSAARYDSAVRDALLTRTGEQPVLFVFPAGNLGEGGSHGLGGIAGGITSPGTAKNVITVGSIEHLRNIAIGWTNVTVDPETGITNSEPVQPYREWTDSDNEVTAFSSRGNVAIGVEGDYGRFKPDVVAPGTFVISTRADAWKPENESSNTNIQEALRGASEDLGEDYRFATGTSYAAPVVSGLAALIQEFFTRDLQRPISPALMKALIISGARSVNALYDVSPRGMINYQGWGLPDITRSLPGTMATLPEDQWSLRFVDQHVTNAVATGETKAWNVQLSTNAQDAPLRVTLVWTDPPGNPISGIKLVNDLDLVIRAPESGQVFYGNNIPADSDFNVPVPEGDTNTIVARDFVNNVENVFIPNPSAFGTNFVISVVGRRVNVNAVHDFHQLTSGGRRTNDVVQDYALVISSGSTPITNAFRMTPVTTNIVAFTNSVRVMTNGLPLMNQTVGANPSLMPRNGVTNQWSFYVFTNTYDTNISEFHTMTNGTNVAFVSFLPANLSRPRASEADIDMFVSSDPQLTNLAPAALNHPVNTRRSVGRSGTEFVVYTNANLGDVFYVAIKSEDQQAAEYGLMVISTDEPFEEQEENGLRRVRLFPTGLFLQDGSPSLPRAGIAVGIPLTQGIVGRTLAEIELDHQNVGDLFGYLRHFDQSVVLNNHTRVDPPTNIFRAIYDDLESEAERLYPGSIPTDGPGNLQNFAGQPSLSPWFLFMVDNAPEDVGRLTAGSVLVEITQNIDLSDSTTGSITVDLPANSQSYFYADLPPGLIEFTTIGSILNGGGPIDMYLRKEFLPTAQVYDVKGTNITVSTNVLKHSITNNPPLSSGRYFLLVDNHGPAIRLQLTVILEYSPSFNLKGSFHPTNSFAIPDNALTNSTITVRRDMAVRSARVGLRVDHPRVSDLAFRLVSPQGTRVNLMENRGGHSTNGLGSGFTNNMSYAVFTERTNGATLIKFANLETLPFFEPFLWDESGFDGAVERSYGVGERVDGLNGFLVRTNTVRVGSAGGGHNSSRYLALDSTNAAVTRTLFVSPGVENRLTFVTARRPINDTQPSFARGIARIVGHEVRAIRATDTWLTNTFTFVPTTPTVELELYATFPGIAFDSVELVETGSRLFLPEEPLTILRGERAMGDWTLEVWDTRAGPGSATNSVSTNMVVDWNLQLDFGFPEMFAAPLPPNGSVTIFTNDTHMFYVDTCLDSTNVTVTLTGRAGRLRLMADREGFPTRFDETDDFAPLITRQTNNTGVATFSLDLMSPVSPVQPGKRIYFAVENVNVRQTNNYTIEAMVSPNCNTGQDVIVLQPNVVHTSTNGVAGGDLFNLFQFVAVPNATRIEVELTPSGGDLSLLVSRGEPPTLDLFDYFSGTPGPGMELITVTRNSSPVPLSPGPWWIGVYNPGGVAVPFNLVVRQTVVTAPPEPGSELRITSIRIAEPTNGTNTVEIFWESLPGQNYMIQAATGFDAAGNALAPGWVDVAGPIPAAGTGNTTSRIITIPPDDPVTQPPQRRFFRIRRL
ncbi:MAG TPA: S8 family serine peptidase [Methylomirabilota bacterium]|nr:S8 family serine peptidase [Methylomirabilota bacterium]